MNLISVNNAQKGKTNSRFQQDFNESETYGHMGTWAVLYKACLLNLILAIRVKTIKLMGRQELAIWRYGGGDILDSPNHINMKSNSCLYPESQNIKNVHLSSDGRSLKVHL